MDEYSGSPRDLSQLYPGGSRYLPTPAGTLERSFLAATRRFRSELLHSLDGLARGNIDLERFLVQANSGLVRTFFTIYGIGVASIWPFHELTERDVSVVRRELFEQQRFLRSFGTDIARGFYVMNPEIRAGLYIRALRGIFELGRLEAYPGPYVWVLGDTHHCLPCLAAATGGPYQKDENSHLGLPVLPGIPGFGDICNGLTHCGCTLRSSTIDLPNTELAEKLRGLLNDVIGR